MQVLRFNSMQEFPLKRKNFPTETTDVLHSTVGKISMCFSTSSCCVVDFIFPCLRSVVEGNKTRQQSESQLFLVFSLLLCCFPDVWGIVLLLLLFLPNIFYCCSVVFSFFYIFAPTQQKKGRIFLWIKKIFVSLLPPVVKRSDTRAGVSSTTSVQQLWNYSLSTT